jgi:hypothetical protein
LELMRRLDCAIKKAWKEDIHRDYAADHLLREDVLKAALRSHILERLGGDGFCRRNRVRLFTEYRLGNGKRADIAIVRLQRLSEMDYEYDVLNRVESVLAIIECKFRRSNGLDAFKHDARKVRELARLASYRGSQFYLAGIQEGIRSANRLGVSLATIKSPRMATKSAQLWPAE